MVQVPKWFRLDPLSEPLPLVFRKSNVKEGRLHRFSSPNPPCLVYGIPCGRVCQVDLKLRDPVRARRLQEEAYDCLADLLISSVLRSERSIVHQMHVDRPKTPFEFGGLFFFLCGPPLRTAPRPGSLKARPPGGGLLLPPFAYIVKGHSLVYTPRILGCYIRVANPPHRRGQYGGEGSRVQRPRSHGICVKDGSSV